MSHLNHDVLDTLRETLGDSEFFEIVDTFVQQFERQLQAFIEHAERRESSDCARILHSLKGGAGNIGAQDLAEIANRFEQQVRQVQAQDRGNANKYGVKMELQADCFAGAWGRMANDRGNVAVTQAEVQQAMDAAQAVGDDRIQASAGQRVNPETWTHGSAAQRQQWSLVGYNSGDINRCNTFTS